MVLSCCGCEQTVNSVYIYMPYINILTTGKKCLECVLMSEFRILIKLINLINKFPYCPALLIWKIRARQRRENEGNLAQRIKCLLFDFKMCFKFNVDHREGAEGLLTSHRGEVGPEAPWAREMP